MFLPAAIALTMLIIGLAVSQGPRAALWAGWTLALLVPTWATRPILSLALDMRTITGITAVGLLLLMIPLAGAIGRWLWCDTFVLLMVFFQWVSMIVTDSFAPSVALLPITLVLLPYLAGRLAVSKIDDVQGLLRWLAYVIVIMSVLSVIESIIHLNLFNTFFGRPTDSGARFEFMRAMGPMSHPIYFGMTLALLLPWAIWGAALSRRGLGPRWWFALPFCCVFGVFSSLSRGPTIATIGTFLCVLFFVLPRMRLWLAGGVLAFGIIVAVAGDVMLDGLRFTESTGDRERAPMRLLVDGEWVEYDGTLHRILLFKVYDEALIAGGWLGHGLPVLGKTDDLTVVGSNVSSILGSIDNHYIYYHDAIRVSRNRVVPLRCCVWHVLHRSRSLAYEVACAVVLSSPFWLAEYGIAVIADSLVFSRFCLGVVVFVGICDCVACSRGRTCVGIPPATRDGTSDTQCGGSATRTRTSCRWKARTAGRHVVPVEGSRQTVASRGCNCYDDNSGRISTRSLPLT